MLCRKKQNEGDFPVMKSVVLKGFKGLNMSETPDSHIQKLFLLWCLDL